MRGRPGRVVVGAVGLAAVGLLAVVATFLPWYQVRGETSTASVSGWSMFTSHGIAFEAPIAHTDSHGPTGAVTFVAGLLLLASGYAAWWLAGPKTRATRLQRQEVLTFAAIVCIAGSLALVLPLAVPAGQENHDFIMGMPRTLCFAGLCAMSVFAALAFVPRHSS